MLISPDIFLKQCLSGYVLHNSLLHLLLKNGDFLNTNISQGSVETRLECGRVFIYHFVTNFLLSLTVKEFWKIGKYLVKLWARVRCLVFLTHSVELIDWPNCGFTSHSTQNRSFRRRGVFPSLAWSWKKTKSNKQKSAHSPLIRNVLQHKINTKKLKPGLVAFYDIWPGNGASREAL